MFFFSAVLTVFGAGLAMLSMFLLMECALAALPKRARVAGDASEVSTAILIPAHNEEMGLAATLRNIQRQVGANDRLLVVADNCTDATARVAAQAGAEVILRDDDSKRGKGFALQAGIDYLRTSTPDVVIVIDADCTVDDGAIAHLSETASATQRPVQACGRLRPTAADSLARRLSIFAFLTKNLVRPSGLQYLGGPCLLCGTGMAFPWEIASSAAFATDDIVEDMKLSVDMVISQQPPLYLAEAAVWSELPASSSAEAAQRTRWEHGHLHTQVTQLPRLAEAFVRRPSFDLLLTALEISVPPLSLFALLLVVGGLASFTIALLAGDWWPLLVHATGCCALAAAIFCSWSAHARDLISFWRLLGTPAYILSKLPIYSGFLVSRQVAWVRTERTEGGSVLGEVQGPHYGSIAGRRDGIGFTSEDQSKPETYRA